MEIIKEIERMQIELERLQGTKNAIAEIKQHVAGIKELIAKIECAIEPNIKIKIKNTTDINYKEISEDVYEKMQGGVVVTRALLKEIYPEWDKFQIYRLFNILKRCANVKYADNGTRRGQTLFIKQ